MEMQRALAAHDPRIVDTAVLLVSELVTNAVRHAGLSPEDRIGLDIDPGPRRIHISVTDEGPGFELGATGSPPDDPDSGWGLYLVSKLSDRYGRSDDASNEVWFDLDLSTA
jgi:anti-sigma regulatory factor (Ser/Thr protein kinase)